MNKKNIKVKIYSGILLVATLICAGIVLANKDNNTNLVQASESNVEDVNVIDDKINNEEEKENINKDEIQEEINKIESILNDPMMILVNKENTIGEDFVPQNLELADIVFLDYIETRNLEAEVGDAAKAMFEAAAKDGITLLGASGYRSYAIQVSLFNGRVESLGEEEAAKYTAKPGTSEHQTGLALDILGADYQYLDDGFENSDSFNWLINNSYKYGFILRYLKGREDITGYGYEPWHYRYIGNEEIAKDIMARDITLEEYINELNKKLEELKKIM